MTTRLKLTLPVIFLISACTSAPQLPKTPSENSQAAISAEVPLAREAPQSANIELKDSKGGSLAVVHVKEITEGLLILLESRELTNGTYQVTLSQACPIKLNGDISSHKVIRKFKIQRSTISDEFKLVGYKLNQDGFERIQGKAMNLVSLPQRARSAILACTQIP